MNKYKHEFTVVPASESQETLDYVNHILKEERKGMEVPKELEEKFKFAMQKSKLAGTIRGSFFVIKGQY